MPRYHFVVHAPITGMTILMESVCAIANPSHRSRTKGRRLHARDRCYCAGRRAEYDPCGSALSILKQKFRRGSS
jgi:hypothetical protein